MRFGNLNRSHHVRTPDIFSCRAFFMCALAEMAIQWTLKEVSSGLVWSLTYALADDAFEGYEPMGNRHKLSRTFGTKSGASMDSGVAARSWSLSPRGLLRWGVWIIS